MSFTQDKVKALRDDIDAALAAVAQKHGVKLAAGSASFNANQCTFKLQALAKTETGEVFSPEAAALKAWAPLLKVDADKVFTVGDRSFKLSGYKKKNRDYPLLATETATGKVYKFSLETVQRAQAGLGLLGDPR